MASTVTIDLRHIARSLEFPLRQVQAVVELLDEGNTVPFITRYRKDHTGGLDEEQIRQIQDRLTKMRQLADRKQTVLRSIEAQGKLTEKLEKQILAATSTKRLEDLYLPYKPKKQTLATLARSRGLEELAGEILDAAPAAADLDARARDFANPDRQVPTAADALLGAGHILAEQFSERADLRQRLREILQRTGKIITSRIGGDAAEGQGTGDRGQAGHPQSGSGG
ncbi:MAG: Tex-like N-terminal domain-containing protein, partial [Thermoguttaceae bacterium]